MKKYAVMIPNLLILLYALCMLANSFFDLGIPEEAVLGISIGAAVLSFIMLIVTLVRWRRQK